MLLSISLNLPRFNDYVPADIEIYQNKKDLSVGIDESLQIESIKINGAEFIEVLTPDEIELVYTRCRKELDKIEYKNTLSDNYFQFNHLNDEY